MAVARADLFLCIALGLWGITHGFRLTRKRVAAVPDFEEMTSPGTPEDTDFEEIDLTDGEAKNQPIVQPPAPIQNKQTGGVATLVQAAKNLLSRPQAAKQAPRRSGRGNSQTAGQKPGPVFRVIDRINLADKKEAQTKKEHQRDQIWKASDHAPECKNAAGHTHPNPMHKVCADMDRSVRTARTVYDQSDKKVRMVNKTVDLKFKCLPIDLKDNDFKTGYCFIETEGACLPEDFFGHRCAPPSECLLTPRNAAWITLGKSTDSKDWKERYYEGKCVTLNETDRTEPHALLPVLKEGSCGAPPTKLAVEVDLWDEHFKHVLLKIQRKLKTEYECYESVWRIKPGAECVKDRERLIDCGPDSHCQTYKRTGAIDAHFDTVVGYTKHVHSTVEAAAFGEYYDKCGATLDHTNTLSATEASGSFKTIQDASWQTAFEEYKGNNQAVSSLEDGAVAVGNTVVVTYAAAGEGADALDSLVMQGAGKPVPPSETKPEAGTVVIPPRPTHTGSNVPTYHHGYGPQVVPESLKIDRSKMLVPWQVLTGK